MSVNAALENMFMSFFGHFLGYGYAVCHQGMKDVWKVLNRVPLKPLLKGFTVQLSKCKNKKGDI